MKKYPRNKGLHIRIQERLLERLRREAKPTNTQADIIEKLLLKRYRLK